ncbi:MAG: hypothetical protein RIQ89_8 [Bacteroidota bacterium]|jgi:hypothetical protein
MIDAVLNYHQQLSVDDQSISNVLYQTIDKFLIGAVPKIWHAHPVWFINENPIVGYSKQKAGIRLMFWSGADFEEPALKAGTGKFKDASVFYISHLDVNTHDLKRWLIKSMSIQWDYKNVVKRKGKLVRLNP